MWTNKLQSLTLSFYRQNSLTCKAHVSIWKMYNQDLEFEVFQNSYGNQYFSTLGQSGRRYSGLQKQVLSLYRNLMRCAKSMKSDENDNSKLEHVRRTFRRDSKSIRRNDIQRIEHFLRRGNKILQDSKKLNMTSIRGA